MSTPPIPVLSAHVGNANGESLKLHASNLRRLGQVSPGVHAVEVDDFVSAGIAHGARGRLKVHVIERSSSENFFQAGTFFVRGRFAIVKSVTNPADAADVWRSIQPIGSLDELREQIAGLDTMAADAADLSNPIVAEDIRGRLAWLRDVERRVRSAVAAEQRPAMASSQPAERDHILYVNVVPRVEIGETGGMSHIDLRRVSAARDASTIGGRAELLIDGRWVVVHCSDGAALVERWKRVNDRAACAPVRAPSTTEVVEAALIGTGGGYPREPFGHVRVYRGAGARLFIRREVTPAWLREGLGARRLDQILRAEVDPASQRVIAPELAIRWPGDWTARPSMRDIGAATDPITLGNEMTKACSEWKVPHVRWAITAVTLLEREGASLSGTLPHLATITARASTDDLAVVHRVLERASVVQGSWAEVIRHFALDLEPHGDDQTRLRAPLPACDQRVVA